MNVTGYKHTLKCQCILPQFKKRKDPVFHEFVVFSTTTNEQFNESFVQCNNCGVVHRVVDWCKSEIIKGKENLSSVATKEELSLQIPAEIISLLESSNSNLAQYQHVAFIIEHDKFGEKVLLEKEEVEGYATGKFLSLKKNGKFKVEPFTYQSEIRRG